MMGRRFAGILIALALSYTTSANAQFQTRWRDQRPQGSRTSPFLSLLATTGNGNRAVIYQGIVRPQVDLQSQINVQDRQIDRMMGTGSEAAAGFGLRGTGPTAGAGSQSLLGQGVLSRIRPQGDAARVNVGHPVYFQYRDQYFPGFKKHSGGGGP